VSVSTIEDRRYEVLFCNGRVLLYPNKGSSVTSSKVFGIRHEKLYKLMFQLARALMHSTNNNDIYIIMGLITSWGSEDIDRDCDWSAKV
jgi:hypothetical protein